MHMQSSRGYRSVHFQRIHFGSNKRKINTIKMLRYHHPCYVPCWEQWLIEMHIKDLQSEWDQGELKTAHFLTGSFPCCCFGLLWTRCAAALAYCQSLLSVSLELARKKNIIKPKLKYVLVKSVNTFVVMLWLTLFLLKNQKTVKCYLLFVICYLTKLLIISWKSRKIKLLKCN